jgi:hypothetical protein
MADGVAAHHEESDLSADERGKQTPRTGREL